MKKRLINLMALVLYKVWADMGSRSWRQFHSQFALCMHGVDLDPELLITQTDLLKEVT